MSEFRMPSLGADMDAGTLYEWFVKPGAAVKRGDVIASVETDKGVIDIEIFEDCVITELLVTPGTRAPVGSVIALLQTAGEIAPAVEAPPAQPAAPVAVARPVAAAPPPTNGRIKVSPAARKRAQELGVDLHQVVGTGPEGAVSLADVEKAAKAGTVVESKPPAPPVAAPPEAAVPVTPPVEEEHARISPLARKVAEELGIDPTAVQGTGPHGAVTRADVERAAAEKIKQAAAPPKTAAPGPTDFQTSMRRAIAAAMARSNRDIPHYYLETRIDMSRPLRWLESENLKRSVQSRILPVVLLIKATAKALSETPELNGYWRDDQFQPSEAIHIGFAVALRQGGLVTPAIHDADMKSLDELMEAMRDLITRTRGGRLRSSELTDATITLTSLGDTGVEKVYGVIYPPQVALVGFGKVIEEPWAENGMVGVRPIVHATLAGDHRASDGRRGAQFLMALEKALQEPELL